MAKTCVQHLTSLTHLFLNGLALFAHVTRVLSSTDNALSQIPQPVCDLTTLTHLSMSGMRTHSLQLTAKGNVLRDVPFYIANLTRLVDLSLHGTLLCANANANAHPQIIKSSTLRVKSDCSLVLRPLT